MDGAGDHLVEYYSTDKADEPNTETIKQLGLRIDNAAPTTKLTYGGNFGAGGSVDISLDATDGPLGSGPVLTQYKVDGGPWKAYSATDEQIFDGTAASFAQWRQAPDGHFDMLKDGSGGITPVGGLGMLWYPVKTYGDFRVKLQFREGRNDGGFSNGGVFVRFPDARVPTAQRPDECARTGTAATSEAWVAIYCGHEIQLMDDPGGGEPQKTGSIYNFQSNTFDKIGVTHRGQWEDYEVEVVGQHYKISRNGKVINEYDNLPTKRSSRSGDPDASKRQLTRGYIGLQNHSTADVMQYRNVRVQDLTPGNMTANPTGLVTVTGDGPHTVEWRSTDAAGNVEAKQMDAFVIGNASAPAPTPLGSPPAAGPQMLPLIDMPATYRLGTLPKRMAVSTLTRRGLSVPVTCTGAMTGSATLTVSRADAKKLHLSRRTLGKSDVQCWGPHTAKVRLKPTSALAKRLKAKGGPKRVKLTVSVQMRDWGKSATTQTQTVTLTR